MTASGGDYHGIIVKESLRDQSLFAKMQVLGQKQGRDWTLLKVGVELVMIGRITDMIQANLITEKDVPYYAHFYRENELIVVFPKRIFRISTDKTSWGEVITYGESVGIPHNELDFTPCRFTDETYQMGPAPYAYSEVLRSFLSSHCIQYRFIEFDEPVKTVEQAARKVPVEKIAKSIVLVDSNQIPFMIILPAENRISYRKVKALLSVKDVRLANEEEVLEYSGYPVGGVPPFNNVKRTFLDPKVLKNTTAIVGGGDINKLVEVSTKSILEFVRPTVADLSREDS